MRPSVCGVPAVFGRPQRAPGDAISRRIQAGKRPAQAAQFREGVLFRAEHIVHDDFASNRRTQPDLAVDNRSTQTLPAFLQNEAANLTFVVLGPDHEDISNRAVGDPHFTAGQAVAAVDLSRPGNHRTRGRAMVRLGQVSTSTPSDRVESLICRVLEDDRYSRRDVGVEDLADDCPLAIDFQQVEEICKAKAR